MKFGILTASVFLIFGVQAAAWADTDASGHGGDATGSVSRGGADSTGSPSSVGGAAATGTKGDDGEKGDASPDAPAANPPTGALATKAAEQATEPAPAPMSGLMGVYW